MNIEKTFRDSYQYILASVISIAFFWLLIVLVRKEVPEQNSALLNISIGALIGSYSTIIGYFYGSSKSSAAKDETLSKIVGGDKKEKEEVK
jgi:hypothetical protein